MTRTALALSALALLGHAAAARAAAASAEAPPRTAIVVGANGDAPGRAPLRYAHRDAGAIADVLTSVGRFAPEHVHVLRDPAPGDVLALVQREGAALAGRKDGMLFFYFSGHADHGALYSRGRPIPLDALRRALDRPDVTVRIGVIDACQGGGWTRAKGLVPDAPFEVSLPQVLDSEGSALIASSTGDESAHESDALGGSFFTVHFASGLRGAADESGDGDVTLTEAFEYARAQTIRDTSRHAREPQHPSFAVNLRGRQDLVLAQIATSPSTLAVDQASGPIELVHLASGVRLLELPPGPRSVRIAVPPGRYVARRMAPDGVHVREVSVPRAGTATVRESELVLVGSERLALKGEEPGGGPRGRAATPAQWGGEVSLGVVGSSYLGDFTGAQTGSWPATREGTRLRVDGRLALTDRIVWKIGTLALAARLGDPDELEIVPYAGMLAWKLGAQGSEGEATRTGLGVGIRRPLASLDLLLTGGAVAEGNVFHGDPLGGSIYRFHVSAGVDRALGASGRMHLGVAAIRSHRPAAVPAPGITAAAVDEDLVLVGSVQELGLETVPLLRFRSSTGWALDVHVAAVLLGGGVLSAREVTAGVGVTRAF